MIDEAQDFKVEWLRLIQHAFLNTDGELVLFRDERQNIYKRELEEKKIKTNIAGAWNQLDGNYRLPHWIQNIASEFYKEFLSQKYEEDNLTVQEAFDIEGLKFDTRYVYYVYKKYPTINDTGKLIQIMKQIGGHLNDICILGTNTKQLYLFDNYLRESPRERSTTTFEEQETYVKLCEKVDQAQISEGEFHAKIKEIRKNKKMAFQMNTGTTKLSTIHSFKGWQVDNLILIIEDTPNSSDTEDLSMDEVIYTGLTRCRQNLIILNAGNAKYDLLFHKNQQWFDSNLVKNTE